MVQAPTPATRQATAIDDEYRCDECKFGRNSGTYYSPDRCVKCDGTSEFEPLSKGVAS